MGVGAAPPARGFTPAPQVLTNSLTAITGLSIAIDMEIERDGQVNRLTVLWRTLVLSPHQSRIS
jgi:hypothetical protein